MKQKLNILFVASEAVPFAKSGGLADVAGALPKAIAALGHEVIVVMPRYYAIDKADLEHIPGPLGVPMGAMGELWAGVYRGTLPNSEVAVYFIDFEQFYGRAGLYDEQNMSYPDNDSRFIFLSKAAFQLAKKLRFSPDIIHANDWHTAVMPILRNTRYLGDPDFGESATVLTIHNLHYQGHFGKGAMDLLEVGWEQFVPEVLEEYDGVNFLKGGIAHADAVTTVSRTYAHEIQTPEYGWGLQDHIRAHAHKLYGILNGVDYEEWSPAVDPYIVKRYDLDDLSGKALCKAALQEEFGLPVRADMPLIGFVGRFVEQKGIGLIAGALYRLLEMDLQIVFLGSGEKWAEGFFSDVARRFPDRVGTYIGYNNPLAHRIEAGCDLFLMPSLFEPCGLNQIYSLRYGTLPIVRATGGLEDTIDNYDSFERFGNGFKFYEASPKALGDTVQWAVETYRDDPEGFAALRENAMQARFGWEEAARAYETLYRMLHLKRKLQRYQ